MKKFLFDDSVRKRATFGQKPERQKFIESNSDFDDSPLLKKYDTKTRTIANAALAIAIIFVVFGIFGMIGFFNTILSHPTNNIVEWVNSSSLIKKRDVTMLLSPAPGNYFLDLPNITFLVHPTNLKYKEKNYRLLSAHPSIHKVVISDGEATWDKEGLFTVIKFLPMVSCYVDFDVINENNIILKDFNGVLICNQNCSHCEVPKKNVHADNGMFNMIEANMFTQFPLKHSTSGQIPSTHNNHNLDGGANPIHMTLPLDNSYVDKTMRLCSTGNQKDTITLPSGMFWEGSESFPVLQFEEKSPCCVDINVVAEDKLNIISRSEACSLFCVDTLGTSCIDPKRPEETNNWHGWWKNHMASTHLFSQDSGPILFINATHYPMTVHYYAVWGSFKKLMAHNIGDIKYSSSIRIADEGVNNVAVGYAPNGYGIADLETSSLTYRTFVMQNDSNTFVTAFGTKQLFRNSGIEMTMWNKTTELEVNNLVATTKTTTDFGDPVSLFETLYVADQDASVLSQLYSGKTGTEYRQSTALAKKLLAKDVTVTSNVYELFNTQSSIEAITRVRTVEPHYVNGAAKIVFSGFDAPYDVLNGNEYLVVANSCTRNQEANPLFSDYGNDPSARTIHHDFFIYLDTSGLPFNATTGRALFTGNATVSVTYEQITSDIEYRPFIASFQYWRDVSHGGDTYHWSIQSSFDKTTNISPPVALTGTYKMSETWSDAEQSINTGNSINLELGPPSSINSIVPGFYSGTRYHWSSIFAAFPPFRPSNGVFSFNRDVRFGDVRQDLGLFNPYSLYSYAITRENYLTDVQVPYWRSAGGLSKYDLANIYTFYAYPGYNGNTFETKMFPYGQLPTYGEGWSLFLSGTPPNSQCPYVGHPMPCYWPVPPGTVDPYSVLFSPTVMEWANTDLFAGLVNVSYTSGKKIGYIRFTNEWVQDYFGFAEFSHLAPSPKNGVRDEEEATIVFLANMMKYLVTDLEVTDIIIDVRGESGVGRPTEQGEHALRSFFGTEDATILAHDKYTHYRASGSVSTNNINDVNIITPGEKNSYARPALTESLYPGSTFAGGNVVILTGGDNSKIPELFVNSAGGRDLGGNTIVKIIGTAESGGGYTNNKYNRVPLYPGEDESDRIWATRSVIVNGEQQSIRTQYATGEFTGENNPTLTKPDPVSSLSGLSGSDALPVDAETLLYPDLGLMSNTRPRLPGDPRPQQPIPNDVSNRGTWRDTWMEIAVEEICASKKRNTFTSEDRYNLAKRGKRMAKRNIQPAQSTLKACIPPHETLTLLQDVTLNRVMFFDNSANATKEDTQVFWQTVENIFLKEIEAGNICKDSDGLVYVEPTVGDLPRIELLHPFQVSQSFAKKFKNE